jgi:hypothetical protein
VFTLNRNGCSPSTEIRTYPAVALGEIQLPDGKATPFDYTLISPEVVRRIRAGTHDSIHYDIGYKRVLVDAKPNLVRVLVNPDLTPDLYSVSTVDGLLRIENKPAFGPGVTRAPAERRAALDMTKERGTRRRILEIWSAIESEFGPKVDGRIVKRVLDRGKDQQSPSIKTVQNHISVLRNEKLIP